MKKLNQTFFILALSLIFVPFLQSCLDDDDEYYLALATFRIAEDEHPYFVLDSYKKMYPQNRMTGELEDGQRVYVHFDILKEEVQGYDYNIEVKGIVKVLTKETFIMTEETADSIGDDRINILSAWFGDDYLNIEYQYMGSASPTKRHMINLVYNETEDGNEQIEEGYVNIEFRHNAHDDYPEERQKGVVAFKGPFGDDGEIGVNIRYNSIYEGVKYLKIKFPTVNGEAPLNQRVLISETSGVY